MADEVKPTPEILRPGQTMASTTTLISEIIFHPPLSRRNWYLALALSGVLLFVLLFAVSYLFVIGVGIWGINIPVAWGFAIINFVWWVGIGHAGTFISAILYLLNQSWRTSINRFAEAMTLFAVACAGLFPLLHLGRPWFAYWLLPYPDTMDLWPQFRSPLVWDMFAVSTYLLVSLIFWYIGLIPDLAILRDRSKNKFYGVMALGWTGASRHWTRYKTAYLLLAGLATPLVVSVHSVVALDFTAGIIPGWHSTIFPPFFVAGAIFSGFAMVLSLSIPLRKIYHLEGVITIRHLENASKLLLVTGMLVSYGYVMEIFMSWYSDDRYEQYMTLNRMVGPYAIVYWTLIFCNVLVPQLLWLKKVRTSPLFLFGISILINVGMWIERFIIVVTSLSRDFMPSAWKLYIPTRWDWLTLLGSFGLFFFLFLLFVRLLPIVSISELASLANEQGNKKHE